MKSADFVVIGGGVIGLRVAIEVRRRFTDARVVLLEKEARCGLHASGRNSGVLHAGFYYTADSFKARFTRRGNQRLARYCDERGLRINKCGKLVVAKHEGELDVLDQLLGRAKRNGVALSAISAADAREIEPRVRTFDRALWSPTTATVDPSEVVEAFAEEAVRTGVQMMTSCTYQGAGQGGIRTSGGRIRCGYVVNAAGLQADRVARDFGFAQGHRILPFKGLYLHGQPGTFSLNTNVYPVPDLQTPFLGVHLTVTVDGKVTIGPTAVPAFWREQYRALENFNLLELLQIANLEGHMFLLNRAGFRDIALRELPKYYRRTLAGMAAKLVEGVRPSDFKTWGPAGIRAQLLDVREYRLEQDFVVEGNERSYHILNAVSPAFTCAIPFAEFVLDQIERLLGHSQPQAGRP